jgi:MFS family permease
MRGSPVYYGWFVLAASAVCEMLIQGSTSYAAGLFVLPLQAEFHISRANANSSIVLLFFGTMLLAPLVGRMLDKRPIRQVMVGGALVLLLCFTGIAMTGSLLAMALLLLVPGAIAFLTLGPLNTSTLASRWFHRRRGLALGLAAVATSGGGFLVVPLLSAAIPAYGWRQALLVEGVIVAGIIMALALLVIRDRPASMGLEDHPEMGGGKEAASAPAPLRWPGILASRAFWIPSLTLASISGTAQATVVTLPAYGVQLGFGLTAAAFLISAFAIAAAVTKVLAGLLADHLDRRWLLIAAAAAMTLSWSLLSLSSLYPAILASACLAGIALGCALPTVGALIAAAFGPLRFGSVMGYTYALTFFCVLLAVRFVGSMYDRFAGYHQAFIAFAILLAAVLLTNLLTPVRKAQP